MDTQVVYPQRRSEELDPDFLCLEFCADIPWVDMVYLSSKGNRYLKLADGKERKKMSDDLIGKKCLLYAPLYDTILILNEYIKNLNLRYHLIIAFPQIIDHFRQDHFEKIIMVNSIFDTTIPQKFPDTEICILNIDSLTNEWTLDNILGVYEKYPGIRIYDYNIENLRLLHTTYDIQNTQFLDYVHDKEEIEPLQQLWQTMKKIYDFGIIAYTPDISYCPRRRVLVNDLKNRGFTVRVAHGFDRNRDIELSRCKIILNIHGKSDNQSLPTLMFEHVRCNRLLYAGFRILSEPSIIDSKFGLRYENLKFMRYHDLLNITKEQIHRFQFDDLEFPKTVRLSEEWTRFQNEEDYLLYKKS